MLFFKSESGGGAASANGLTVKSSDSQRDSQFSEARKKLCEFLSNEMCKFADAAQRVYDKKNQVSFNGAIEDLERYDEMADVENGAKRLWNGYTQEKSSIFWRKFYLKDEKVLELG